MYIEAKNKSGSQVSMKLILINTAYLAPKFNKEVKVFTNTVYSLIFALIYQSKHKHT